jgi:uncharacterized cysteine cluster protein YcgN (CxxCxxCC family)
LETLTNIYIFKYAPNMKNNDNMSTEWENLCNKCGSCCFEKIEDESGTIFFTNTPCRYLDVESRFCKIYDRRFEIYPDCIKLTEDLVRELAWLDDDCGYRKNFGITRKAGKTHKKM